jgi:tRNA A22 N-methylase
MIEPIISINVRRFDEIHEWIIILQVLCDKNNRYYYIIVVDKIDMTDG